MIDKNFKGINEINKILKIVLGAIIIFFIVFMAIKKVAVDEPSVQNPTAEEIGDPVQ